MRNNLRGGLLAVGLGILFVAGLASPARAQMSASVTGTVEDKSGAILKGASVTAVNQKTLVEYKSRSNEAGIYIISGLPIGSYTIKAEAQGMRTAQTNPITLEVGQTARVALKLEVG